MNKTRGPLLDASTVALAVVAAFALGWSVASARGDGASSVEPQRTDDVRIRSAGHVVGSEQPELEVVVFTDYYCEKCAQLHQLLEDSRMVWGDRLAVRYRHYPLTIAHPRAIEASIGVECGAAQGRFSETQGAVFRVTTTGSLEWSRVISEAQIPDTRGFLACLEDPSTRALIEADRRLAIELALRGTPGVVIEDRVFYSVDVIDEIARRLAEGPRTSE